MPEYIYLLEHRLSPAQKHALTQVRDAAHEAGTTVFLAGGAVRDLTTGSSVRNFDFTVQGNALELEGALTSRGAELWGKHEPTRTLTFWFPGSVRVTVASARSEEYPKPGKPVYHWSSIVEDLRRRDFTANAMALSLNEGSYGLLLDPLNGVADIEARLLRLASNYGFIEDPSRLIRATRLRLRLGWQMDEKTATRYANAKEAESINALSPYLRGYEIEKIASEEDALDTLKALEAEGWMEHLMPGWTSAQADVAGLENLRRNWIQLMMQGVSADLTVSQLELLTAKLPTQEIAALKKVMVHPGLVRHWEALDEGAKEFARQLTGKGATSPSATWKLLTTYAAEPILWLAHTRKTGSAADIKLKNFFTVWPEFKKRVPAAMMLEMRITPELPGYKELLEQLFYELIDGNLETDEQMRAFLEPYSPPAPPPPPTVRRSRAKKSESKTKRRTAAPDDDEDLDEDDDTDADADDEAEAAVVDDEEEEEVEDEALTSALDALHGVKADDADAVDDLVDEKEDELGASENSVKGRASHAEEEEDGDDDDGDEPSSRTRSPSSRGKSPAKAVKAVAPATSAAQQAGKSGHRENGHREAQAEDSPAPATPVHATTSSPAAGKHVASKTAIAKSAAPALHDPHHAEKAPASKPHAAKAVPEQPSSRAAVPVKANAARPATKPIPAAKPISTQKPTAAKAAPPLPAAAAKKAPPAPARKQPAPVAKKAGKAPAKATRKH